MGTGPIGHIVRATAAAAVATTAAAVATAAAAVVVVTAAAAVVLAPAARARTATVQPASHERAVALRTPGRVPAAKPPRPIVRAINPRRLAAAKAAAQRRARLSSRAAAAPPLARAASAGLNLLDRPGLSATDALFGVPPDTTGAIGPADYVEEVNDAVAVFRRSDLSRVAGPIPNEVFMRPPFPAFVSDPQVQWDSQSGRWIYLAVAFTVDFTTLQIGGPNYLVYGFSKTSDPTDLANGWCHYSLASGTSPDGKPLLDDFPKLGHDDRHLIFGTNVFAGSTTFVTARVWSVPKPPAGPLAACPAPPVATAFGSAASPLRTSDGTPASTPVPANTTGSSRAGYVVAADDPTAGPRNQVMIWHVGGSATSPTLTPDGDAAVPTYRVPRPARDFIFPPIDTLDGRLTMAVAGPDRAAGGQEAVWTQHTIDPGNGSVVMRWYELLPQSRTVRQTGTVTEPGVDVFNGSVAPADGGTGAVVSFNRSGLFLLPELDARTHTPPMSLGATGSSIRLGSSTALDWDLSCAPVCRWGDYAGASPDPLFGSRVWVAGQVLTAPGGLLPSWTTRIASLDVVGG